MPSNTGSSSPIVVTGLTNGVEYTATVHATNAVGDSVESSPSAPFTPSASATVPGAPTIGTATAGDAEATANWTAPGSDGGSAITGYQVKTYDGSGTLLFTDTVGVVLTYTKTGLTNGTAVKFKVAAINAVGTGAQSGFSNTVTPAAPTGFSDDFNRADVSPIDNGWVNIGGSTANVAAVVSNQAKITAAPVPLAIWVHETGLANGTFAIDIIALPSEVGIVFWAADANNWAALLPLPSGEYRVLSNVAGTTTVHRDVVATFPAPPFTLSLVISGNSITASAGGTAFLTAYALPSPVFAALGANTKAGFGAGYGGSPVNGIYDNFSVS